MKSNGIEYKENLDVFLKLRNSYYDVLEYVYPYDVPGNFDGRDAFLENFTTFESLEEEVNLQIEDREKYRENEYDDEDIGILKDYRNELMEHKALFVS